MMEAILIAAAIGGERDKASYVVLRSEIISDPVFEGLIPSFVRTCRNLDMFWAHVKSRFDNYEERVRYIRKQFAPIFKKLEERDSAPSDQITSETLERLDVVSVHRAWEKALARRSEDPEGAITMARTLLETVMKGILTELHVPFSGNEQLPKLFNTVAESLNISPSQHAIQPMKEILGGVMKVVNGIGTLRNRYSDAHGHAEEQSARPTPRHAGLAVNTAGSVAAFLVETFLEEHRPDA